LEKYETDIELLKLKQENAYNDYREDERHLRMELEEVRSNWHYRLLRELRTFDEALREQIDELNLLKTKVTEKDDQIFKLKDVVFTCQSVNTALRAEIEIEKLKSIGERKTQQVAY
jgi:ERCC4-type nuclease